MKKMFVRFNRIELDATDAPACCKMPEVGTVSDSSPSVSTHTGKFSGEHKRHVGNNPGRLYVHVFARQGGCDGNTKCPACVGRRRGLKVNRFAPVDDHNAPGKTGFARPGKFPTFRLLAPRGRGGPCGPPKSKSTATSVWLMVTGVVFTFIVMSGIAYRFLSTCSNTPLVIVHLRPDASTTTNSVRKSPRRRAALCAAAAS